MIEVWMNNAELRQTIENELDNWGNWSRQGNAVMLKFPSSAPWTAPPDKDPPRPVIVDLAEASEHVISTWSSVSDHGRRLTFLLKLVHIEKKPVESVTQDFNRKFKCKKQDDVIEAMIDEARMMYWMLTYK